MKRATLMAICGLFCAEAFLSIFVSACDDGEDAVVVPPDGGAKTDGAVPDATTQDAPAGETSTDAGDGGVSTGVPPWLFITANGQTSSELVVYGLGNRQVGGRLPFPGFIGLTYIDSAGRPFLLQQSNDRVVELDPIEPWKERASWNVAGNDAVDGGSSYADPVGVLPVATGKAYVLRFNRNRIAVIDDTVKADATAPTKTIDLTQFFDPADTDTSVDPIAAVVANGKVYVLLANIDLNNVDLQGYYTICSATKPKIIVIDPSSDALATEFVSGDAGADAGDGGPAVVSLLGYNPTFNGLIHDAPRQRLLVFNGGCNVKLADGGKGALERRQVDAIDLQTGTVTKALDLNAEGYPSAVVPLGNDEVALGLEFSSAKVWNITTASLGASLPSGVTAMASDRKGRVYAVVDTSFVDGGTAKEMIEVSLDSGAVNPLGPFPGPAGFVGSADYYPGQ